MALAGELQDLLHKAAIILSKMHSYIATAFSEEQEAA